MTPRPKEHEEHGQVAGHAPIFAENPDGSPGEVMSVRDNGDGTVMLFVEDSEEPSRLNTILMHLRDWLSLISSQSDKR